MLAPAPLERLTAGGLARSTWTTRADGDFHADFVAPADLERRQRAVVDLPWTFLAEEHGAEVVVVGRPGEGNGRVADAAVTTTSGAVLGVWVGDCAPVVLVSEEGVIGAAHAGWRGLVAGVLPATVAAMRGLGAGEVEAQLGPCIHADCYEFGPDDLQALTDRFGSPVPSTTASGAPALDLVAAVRASLAEVDVDVVATGPCTGCDVERFWSHRVRGELGRQAMAVWLEPA
jgi:copper oxidase (laccase) domain-containing protein